MSDKRLEGSDKMSVEVVSQARGMADFIIRSEHRGPGDTVEAAIHRAARNYGVPAQWLHRLRYRHRSLRDLPASAFLSLVNACQRASETAEKAYQYEKALADARNSKLAGLASALAGEEAEGSLK
ncbi:MULTISPECIES: hypothetical protein [Chelativorans]|uniref:Uncharacterized protein n=1 Tax=Chelativorans sp. (strain BNC1) TaxID=266779 RepID=Q11LV6_CHESB|nr:MULTISPECIES: hypothetical protein [Chelativorans]